VAIASHWGFHRQPGSVENPDDLEAAEPWAWDYELRLAPTHDLDPTNGTPLPPAVTVSPLAAVLNDRQLSASLHEAHEECRTDVPAWEPHEPKPHSDFVRAQQERLEDGGGGLIAHRRGQVLAATFADRAAFVPILHNDFTMVHRSARGQHLALAIKSRLVHEAARTGIERITTEVRTDNHPMLAINATLGFRRIAMRHLVQSTAPELLQ
jgi:RimJ/RimL family protein N-acetyltransferase